MDIGSLFWLDIGGGEPFLRADLPELIAAFDARVIMIPSNGLMTDDIYGGLKEITEQSDSEVGISLSLDGLQETNDQIRHKGSWEAVWATFERVRSLDTVSVKINTVLCKENHAEILELMEEVRKHRPDFHSVILLRDTPNAPPTKLPDLRDLRKLSQDILRIQERYSYGRNRIAYFPHILNALIQDMSYPLSSPENALGNIQKFEDEALHFG